MPNHTTRQPLNAAPSTPQAPSDTDSPPSQATGGTHGPGTPSLFTKLTKAGLSQEAASAWSRLAGTGTYENVLRVAMAWQEVGIEPNIAVEWSQLDGWSATDALPWYLIGYTPDEAELCDWLIFRAEQRHRQGPTPSNVEEWLTSGLSPRTVVRALTIGVTDVERARQLDNITTAEPEFGGTLDLLRAIAQSHPDD